MNFLPLFFLSRPGKQAHVDAQTRHHAAQTLEMLRGQDFGRRHQAGLGAVVDGQKHGHQRHYRLARADVALDEAVHLTPRGHIIMDFVHHALLRAGEVERQHLTVKTVEEGAHALHNITLTLLFAAPCHALDIGLDKEQLLEFQAHTRRLQTRIVGGSMQRHECLAQRHEPVIGQYRRGQRLGQVGTQFQSLLNPAVEGARGDAGVTQLLGQRVDAAEALHGSGAAGDVDLGMRQRPFARRLEERRLAEKNVFGTDMVCFPDCTHRAEPQHLYHPRSVAEQSHEALLGALAGDRHRHEAPLQLHRRHVALEVGDAVDAAAVDIVAWEMPQKVVGRSYAQLLLQKLGTVRPYAFYKLYIVIPERVQVSVIELQVSCGSAGA